MDLFYVINRLPKIQGYALMAWHTMANPYANLDISGAGYIAQEASESLTR